MSSFIKIKYPSGRTEDVEARLYFSGGLTTPHSGIEFAGHTEDSPRRFPYYFSNDSLGRLYKRVFGDIMGLINAYHENAFGCLQMIEDAAKKRPNTRFTVSIIVSENGQSSFVRLEFPDGLSVDSQCAGYAPPFQFMK